MEFTLQGPCLHWAGVHSRDFCITFLDFYITFSIFLYHFFLITRPNISLDSISLDDLAANVVTVLYWYTYGFLWLYYSGGHYSKSSSYYKSISY
jgi:hypothetical protein